MNSSFESIYPAFKKDKWQTKRPPVTGIILRGKENYN